MARRNKYRRHLKPFGDSRTDLGRATNYWNDVNGACDGAVRALRQGDVRLAEGYLDAHAQDKAAEAARLFRELGRPEEAEALERRVRVTLQHLAKRAAFQYGHRRYHPG